jgi:hypothetical protein
MPKMPLALLLGFLLFAVGCAKASIPPTPVPTDTPAATAAPTATHTPAPSATPTEPAETPTPTATPCDLAAAFVRDVTIPDDTSVAAGESFDKEWALRNSGPCTWPADTWLTHVSGEQMAASERVRVPVTDPGDEAAIGVRMTAPEEPGTYESRWRLEAGGERFGPTIWVRIVVPAS